MRNLLSNIQTNFGGIKTPKVLVFQSDDWGFSRTNHNDDSIAFLKNKNLQNLPYNSIDGLESIDDLKNLQSLLESYKDKNGIKPIFTLNYVTSNPDFQQIEDSNFSKYYRVPIAASNDHTDLKVFWSHSHDVFDIQFHGLDHLNVGEWMNQLRNQSIYLKGFKHKLIEFTNPQIDNNKMVALRGLGIQEGIEYFKMGIDTFSDFFSFEPISFIPPNYWLDNQLLNTIEQANFTSIQGMKYRFSSRNKSYQKMKRKNGYFEGESNLISLVRNIQLEPTLQPNKSIEEIVKKAVDSLRVAYYFGQPAIVDTHRINYTAKNSKSNRDKGIGVLDLFLKETQKLFPDVQFWSTKQLTYYYKNIYESNK